MPNTKQKKIEPKTTQTKTLTTKINTMRTQNNNKIKKSQKTH